MQKFLYLVMAWAILPTAWAQIWTDTNTWNEDWERRYSSFVNSSKVTERMFVDSSSPYYGVEADCADAAYALRVIFAYQNSLPFAIRNPSGVRRGEPAYHNFNNRITRFNHIRNPERRLVEFINYIGSSVGSENLTRNDTFPVAINSIRGGDIFTYRIRARFNNFIRHVYNLKAVNPTGTFDVIYSTQAIADKGLPMIRRREREFAQLPHDAWGFRRFRWPEEVGLAISNIPSSRGNSNEQYDLVRQHGDRFFREVRNRLATVDETPNDRLQRSLNNLCIEAQARVDFVNQGLEYLRNNGNRCMDYAAYDAYSTPARDEALNQTFLRTKETYEEIVRNRQDGRVSRDILRHAEAIFANGRGFESELLRFCPINYRAGVSIDLAELHRRQNAGRLSSHPNDPIEHRWGENTRISRTRCRAFY
jgi:hypothetical protein